MCGISGFIGKKVNKEKMKVIVIMNDTRGKHSCGLYYDNQVFYGVDANSKMPDFLTSHQIPNKLKNPTIMLAHSRSATMGTHTKENAHPITIGLDEDNNYVTNRGDLPFLMVGVHNGVIKNYIDLRQRHLKELDIVDFNIDSKVLLGNIFLEKDDPKNILESYRGTAALMWTTEPGVLNVFKGAAGGDLEERPLFFLKEPEGYYFSSMIEPLKIIKTTEQDEKVYTCYKNAIMQFTVDGGYQGKIEVDRQAGMDEEEKKPAGPPYSRNSSSFSEHADAVGGRSSARKSSAKSDKPGNTNTLALKELDKKAAGLTLGDLEMIDYRYHRNGKPITGMLLLDDTGKVHDKQGFPYWFFEGIMVSEEGFLEIARRMIESNDDLFEVISTYSRYPVYATQKNDVFRNKTECGLLILRGEIFTGSVHPAFYDHCYVIENGIFTDKKIRKIGSEQLYKDQCYQLNPKSGSRIQLLRDRSGKKERVLGSGEEEILDLGPLPVPPPLIDAVDLPNANMMFDPAFADYKDQTSLSNKLKKALQREADSYVQREAMKKQIDAAFDQEKQNGMGLGNSSFTEVTHEEFDEDEIAKSWDELEAEEEIQRSFERAEAPAFISESEGSEDYLEEVNNYLFSDKIICELEDILVLMRSVLLRYGKALEKRQSPNAKALDMLLTLDEARKSIEATIEICEHSGCRP